MNTDGVMFNAYPDSCGGNLSATVKLLERPEFKNVFKSFYLLPSMFRSDLDRGFSIISYNLDNSLVSPDSLDSLRQLGIQLKLDIVLNHLSVQSPEFQDILNKGEQSPFCEMFIDWNEFWKDHGETGPQGYVIPDKEYLSRLFMRKPELPILETHWPDGTSHYYWNTFYQKKDENYPGEILGQVDLNAESEITWSYYENTIEKLSSFGARILRLDAFAYLHKRVGETNFFNKPGTLEYLQRIQSIASRYELTLLPEIHSKWSEGVHRELAEKGYLFYDFFFPALLIDALENAHSETLIAWIEEIRDNQYRTVNMLGCHDGIPVLDVCGLLPDERIDQLISTITSRGGFIKNLFDLDGKKISYYQVNATFFSALGENEQKMQLARAIQIFMPGVPEVWYLDLFAGTNDYNAASELGHKEINRTNLSVEEINSRLNRSLIQNQLKMLRFRNTFPAFNSDGQLSIESRSTSHLALTWTQNDHTAILDADLLAGTFSIRYDDGRGQKVLMGTSKKQL